MRKINTFFGPVFVLSVLFVVSMFAPTAAQAAEVNGRGSRNEHLETISIEEGTGFEGWIVTFNYPNDEPEVCNVARAVLSGRKKPAAGVATVNLNHSRILLVSWKSVTSFTDSTGNSYPCMYCM
jgi:hypothetical protein